MWNFRVRLILFIILAVNELFSLSILEYFYDV